jgi:hypothetical protein
MNKLFFLYKSVVVVSIVFHYVLHISHVVPKNKI